MVLISVPRGPWQGSRGRCHRRRALAEQRRADPHPAAARCRGLRPVAAHPHRQLRHAQIRRQGAGLGKQPLPRKAVLLTFDDGYLSLYTRVFPLLLAYRIPAVAALVGEW
ncbi:MAG: hypothetical protein EBR33_12480 [Synechococcaceae bacterium WB4_1_0192]|nr:hypothetical protein [Synechococcaceae bacterium WB4_1_0192]